MKPYRLGNYVVGNRFLMDLITGRISFHCRRTMQLLTRKLPPDGSFTEDDRMAAFAPAIEIALARQMPASGCEESRRDPFWGTSGARPHKGRPPFHKRLEKIVAEAEDWADRMMQDIYPPEEYEHHKFMMSLTEHDPEPKPPEPYDIDLAYPNY